MQAGPAVEFNPDEHGKTQLEYVVSRSASGYTAGVKAGTARVEEQMCDSCFAAVKQSLRNTRQAGSANRFAREAFRAVMRIVATVPPLQRRMADLVGL